MDENNNEMEITLDTADYPQLEGVTEGSPIDMRCKGTVGKVNQDGSVTLTLSECNIETEGQADKAMKEMSAQSNQDEINPDGGESDF